MPFKDEICDDNDDCFNLTDEMTKLEEKAKEEEESDKPVFQMNQMSSGKADCKIRKNNYISCAAVQQQERMDNIKTGLFPSASTAHNERGSRLVLNERF